ncbi:MAG: hypothetical protein WD766_00220 [Gemmatimonadota bacterium]
MRYPEVKDFVNIARDWAHDAAGLLLQAVWDGFDKFADEVLSEVDPTQADEDLERSVTQLLAERIRRCMPAMSPFFLEHGIHEHETRLSPPAQPPLYDLAFVVYENPRLMLPLEAKTLRSDRSVGPYVRDVKAEFLTCRYAPFSSEAAMLGYLLKGDPNVAFARIASSVRCALDADPRFNGRDHKVSAHTRTVPTGKDYPRKFRCHHMIFRIAA